MYKLKEALDSLSGYDRIYIDTPPAVNFNTRSALIAAHRCLIPFDCDDFSKRALQALLNHVSEIKQDHNASLEVEGIVINHYQPRANLPRRIVESLIDEGLPVIGAYLSSSVKIRESHEKALPMIFLDKNHKLTQEFVALYKKIEG
jgi:chromosome partitioning protein